MSKPRKALSKTVEYLLWSSSGGFCEFDGCEQRLIFEDVGKIVNIADKAHIISHSPKGPRGEEREKRGMNEEEIDSPDNIILLCQNHHKLVDANPEKYTVDILCNMKRKHEQWVLERLTKVNTSVAILHKTKGPPVDEILLANKLNLKVLGLASLQENLDNISQIDWITVKKKNVELYKEALELLHTFKGTLFNVFPLSQIPLLIHLGNLITDTIPIQVFQYDRNTGNWCLYAPDTKELEDLGLTYDLELRNSKTLIVSLAISSTIQHDDINAMISIGDCDFLEITIREPAIDKVLYKEDVDSVKNCFKSQVERLHQQYRYDEIHLFYAGPAGLAVELGRAINRKMWPEVHLYHYDYRSRPHYQKAFSI